MNLARLMDQGVSPPVIADALIARFELVNQYEIASGGWPFQHVLAAGHCEEGRPRLLILFAWFGTGWHYQAVHPNRIPRLRLCAGQ